MSATKKRKKTIVFVLLVFFVMLFTSLFIYEKKERDKFFEKKQLIKTGMQVNDLINLVGKPTFESLVDSSSIKIASFPKEIVNSNNKIYIFTYTVPTIKNWIWKFNNLDFSYKVYVDEKKEKVIFY
jgi:hypothetical protein